MKRTVVTMLLVLVVALSVGIGVSAESIYRSDTPMPSQFLSGTVGDKEVAMTLRNVFPKASFKDRGLRLYLPDTFSLVPVGDFIRLAEWYWSSTLNQLPEDAAVGLVGLASSLPPWSRIPIGFAVRGDKYPTPYIYVVFVTKECGQFVAYRFYPADGKTVCERITKDCLVRLVVLF